MRQVGRTGKCAARFRKRPDCQRAGTEARHTRGRSGPDAKPGVRSRGRVSGLSAGGLTQAWTRLAIPASFPVWLQFAREGPRVEVGSGTAQYDPTTTRPQRAPAQRTTGSARRRTAWRADRHRGCAGIPPLRWLGTPAPPRPDTRSPRRFTPGTSSCRHPFPAYPSGAWYIQPTRRLGLRPGLSSAAAHHPRPVRPILDVG